MYVLKPGTKQDRLRHWALPDRHFFASGACHILAHTFMETYPDAGYEPIWIEPARGFTGNHIVAVRGEYAFDYHGYTLWPRLLAHMTAKAQRWWPGWSATLVSLPKQVLVSEPLSRTVDGLWLREPGQFPYDPVPRAQCFVCRFADRVACAGSLAPV